MSLSSLMRSPRGPGFTFQVDNLTGTPTTAGPGTQFTTGGGNSDGTPVSVLSALARDVHLICVEAAINGTAAEDNSSLLDLLVDPAGGTAWQDLVSDLIVGTSTIASAGQLVHKYWFQICVPAGSSLGVQARKTGATGVTGRVAIWAFGCPKRGARWWCGQKVDSIGIDAANSKGTAHTPGASGAYSAFASIGSATARPYGGLQLGVQSNGNTTLNRAYHCQAGLGGSQLPGSSTIWHSTNTSEVGARAMAGPWFVDVPAGSQLQYRATASGTVDTDHNVAFYGVY